MTIPDIITQPIEPNRRLSAQGIAAYPSSFGEAIGAVAADAWTRNPTTSLFRAARRLDREMGTTLDDLLGAPARKRLSAAEANERYGIAGHLSFDGEVVEENARELRDLKEAELRRQDVLARSRGGLMQGASSLTVGLVVGMADPLNIASAYVPVVGQARYGRMLAQAGSAGSRAGVRAGIGAAEGAVGAALLEPIVYGVAQQEQADYGLMDSLLNLGFGTVMGGGLHVATGYVGDAITGRYRTPVERQAEGATLESRKAALKLATAAVAEGRAPGEEVQAVLTLAGGQARPRQRWTRNRGTDITAPQEVYDAEGTRYLTRMEVVDADDLTVSQTDEGTVNPAYPAELQPRERERAASQQQITEMAANLKPGMLAASPDASTGAPIAGPDGVVESGNGRVLAIRRAYAQHPERAEAYRAYLQAQGFDVTGKARPVLVRRRISELDQDARRRLTVAAQKSATLDLSATERAMADARLLDSKIDLYKGGDLTSVGNAPFIRAIVDDLPPGDRGSIADKDGVLSAEGARRIRNALLARAFDDADLLGRMLETADEGNAAIGGALMDLAGPWARMRAMSKRGEIAPVDSTADLLAAVKLIRDQRAAGRPLVDLMRQMDAFSTRSPATDLWLSTLLTSDRNGNTVVASRTAIVREMQRYVDEALKSSPDPGLFADIPVVTPERMLEELGRRRDPMPGIADPEDAAVAAEAAQAPAEPPRARTKDTPSPEEVALDAEIEQARTLGLVAEDEPELSLLREAEEDAAAMQREIMAATGCLIGGLRSAA